MASPDYLSILDDILGKYDYNGIKLPEAKPSLANKQVLGAWGKPTPSKGKLPSSPPSGTVDPKSMASGAIQGLGEMMQVPQAITEQASSDLTGKPASAWAKQGMGSLSPGIQMLNGAIANLKQVNPHWGEVADAMKDEAETHAAKLGTDPMMYMLPASRILSTLFGMQSAAGAGESAGQGLAEYDKSGSITPEVGRAAVRSIVQLGMGGLAASHGVGEIGKGVGPDVTFGEGKSSLGDFAKQALPSFEKKPVSALGTSPDIDKYLDSLNSEDITKPIGYKSGELTDPQYQVPNKPDSQWKRVKAGSNGATPDWMGQAADNLSGKNRPKATLTSDMLGLQQTWEKGRSLIDSLKAKGKVIPGPKRIAGDGNLARAEDGEGNPLRYDNALGLEVPVPIKPEKVPIVKSGNPDSNATQGERNLLMGGSLGNKWRDSSSGYQRHSKEFDPDPEIAKHLETFKAVDHFFENVDSGNSHLFSNTGYPDHPTAVHRKFAALVKDTPASIWRTRANLDNEWYYNRLNKLADEWKDWPDRPGSILLKQAVKSITGSKAEIYNPRQHKITPAALKVYTPIVERMYRESQEALHNTDFEHIASKEGGFSTTRTIKDEDPSLFAPDVFEDVDNDKAAEAHDLMDEHIDKQDDPYKLRDDLDIQSRRKIKAVVSKDQPTLHLYRGVAHDAKDKFGILESWTTYKPVAEGFGGSEALLEADIPKSQILTFHRSPNWRQHVGGIGENEFEYIVIGKPVDAAKLARQVGKVKAATAPGVAKEVFGKPPDPIELGKNQTRARLYALKTAFPDMQIDHGAYGQVTLKEPDGKETTFTNADGLSQYLYSKHSPKPVHQIYKDSTPTTIEQLKLKYPNDKITVDHDTGNILHWFDLKGGSGADDIGNIKQADAYLESYNKNESDHESKYGESAKGLGKTPNPVQVGPTVKELGEDNPEALFVTSASSEGTLYYVYGKNGGSVLGDKAYTLDELLDSPWVSKELSDKYKNKNEKNINTEPATNKALEKALDAYAPYESKNEVDISVSVALDKALHNKFPKYDFYTLLNKKPGEKSPVIVSVIGGGGHAKTFNTVGEALEFVMAGKKP